MKHAPGRFLAVNLSEAEYQAVRSATNDPTAWLKAQIDDLLAKAGLSHVQSSREDEPVVPAWSYTVRG